MKKLEVANKLFTVITGDKAKEQIISNYKFFTRVYGRRGLYDAYKTPSSRKISINNDWRAWCKAAGINADNMVVLGANSNTFSLGIYDNANNRLFYITKSYNKVVNDVYTI